MLGSIKSLIDLVANWKFQYVLLLLFVTLSLPTKKVKSVSAPGDILHIALQQAVKLGLPNVGSERVEPFKNCYSEFHIAAIIITGGDGQFRDSVELLFPNGTFLCSLPSIGVPKTGHTQSGLVNCGGWSTAGTCFTFSGGQWNTSHSLLYPRRDHSSWSSTQHGPILIGSNYFGGPDSTTEMVTETGESQESFTLKYQTR